MPILFTVKELINAENAITKEQGEKLYLEVESIIKCNMKAVIDFTSIKSYSQAFRSASIDKLVKDLSPTTFKNKIEIRNLK